MGVNQPKTVAIISDIHGNRPALDAVLDDLESRLHDELIIAGDLVLHGPFPAETLERLRTLDAVAIRGNTDAYLLAPEPPARLQELPRWCRQQIGNDGRRYLSSLGFDARITPPGGTSPEDDLLIVHATPTSIEAVLSLEPDPFGEGPATPEETAVQLLGGVSANLIVYGHIHRASAGTVNGQRLASIGSVGFPHDGDHRAAYALAHWDGKHWHIEHRRVPYDHESVASALVSRDVPLAEVLKRRLLSARFVPFQPL